LLLAFAGKELDPVSVPQRDRTEAALRARLGETAFAVAWGEGGAMVAEGEQQVVAYALEPASR
jgi:hypothetical protein